jgi:transcriptional regulator with XRE-family HTH domain
MSPIAALLQAHRRKKFLRQAELAVRIGYEQSYISALEVGLKGPPTPEFVNRFAEALSLSGSEREELDAAAEASHRRLVIEPNAPTEVYRLVNRLRSSLSTLTPAQANVISEVLGMALSDNVGRRHHTSVRPRSASRKEPAM